MRFKLIAVGVNEPKGGKRLSFAEQDATKVRDLLVSDLGPATPGTETLLIGPAATVRAVHGALAETTFQRPDILLFYFSGHGGSNGVALSDDVLLYKDLAEYVQLIGAARSMQILDVCSAASYLSFIKEATFAGAADLAWLEVLANSAPGNRLIFSTGADRSAGEAGPVRGGHFTEALLRALREGAGDLEAEGSHFISDRMAFLHARWIMRHDFKLAQLPVERGLRGDFPFAKSQAGAPVGSATILKALVQDHGLDMLFWVDQRRGVPTVLKYSVINSVGGVIVENVLQFTPPASGEPYHGRIPFAQNTLLSDPTSYLQLKRHGRVDFSWALILEDGVHGHVLDEQVVGGILI